MLLFPCLATAALALAAPIQADLHLDTPTQMVRKNIGFDAAGLEGGLTALDAGGTNVAMMVLWPPREGDWAAQVETLFSKVEAEDERLARIKLARSPTEARSVVATGGVALVVSVEGAHGIHSGGVAALERLHARGLSALGLTWSFSNRFAGSSGDGGGGLTADGRALVAAANRLGVIVDVSHASHATTLETCAVSTAPVIASHSDAWTLSGNVRNLHDDEIDCIARSGGVIGLNFHDSFVGKPASISKVADHADYLKKHGGIGVVALGSDFDGLIHPATGLENASKLPALWAELRRRGWSEAEITAARGENFMRAWQAVLSATSPR